MSNEENRPLQRIIVLLELFLALSKKYPDQETFELNHDFFQNTHKLLADLHGRNIAFDTINKEARESILIHRYEFNIPFDARRDPTASLGPAGMISVHIDDPEGLRKYLNEVKHRLEKKKEEVIFEMEVEKKSAHVRVKGTSSKVTCPFSVGGGRYRILKVLGETKTYITSRELAEKAKIASPDEARAAIDSIRNRISKTLEVERGQVISLNPETGEGYGFLNLEIKE